VGLLNPAFARGASALLAPETPLYHIASLFVNRQFEQNFNPNFPRICATFLLKTVDFLILI